MPASATHWLPSVQAGDGDAEKTGALPDPMAAELVRILRKHNGQKRPYLIIDPCLTAAAQDKVFAMAQANEMAHVIDGRGPNQMLMGVGCYLPPWYPREPESNNIESIGRGYSSEQEMVDAWIRSPAHSLHVLGLVPFFEQQVRVGAGMHWDYAGHPWWCFLSAPAQPEGT